MNTNKRCDECGGWRWYYYNHVNDLCDDISIEEFVVCTSCGLMTPFDKDKLTLLSFFKE